MATMATGAKAQTKWAKHRIALAHQATGKSWSEILSVMGLMVVVCPEERTGIESEGMRSARAGPAPQGPPC